MSNYVLSVSKFTQVSAGQARSSPADAFILLGAGQAHDMLLPYSHCPAWMRAAAWSDSSSMW